MCVESQAHQDRARRESVRPITLHAWPLSLLVADSLPVLLQRIWYSRRPGCTAEGRIRTLDLSAAVLNPSPALRRQRAFELTTPHERVLFVAANSAEWVHWLGVLTPLLDPKLAACFDSVPIGPAADKMLIKAGALVPDHTRKRSASFSTFSYGRAPQPAAVPQKVRRAVAALADEVTALPLGDWALGEAGNAVMACPGDARSWSARGQALAKLGRRRAAKADFEAALRLDPDLSGIHLKLEHLRPPDEKEIPGPAFACLVPTLSKTPSSTAKKGVRLTPRTRALARRTLSLSPDAPANRDGEVSPPSTPDSEANGPPELAETPPQLGRSGVQVPHSVGCGQRSRRVTVDSEAVVVVDTGSASLRAGFAGEGAPRVIASMHGGHRVGLGSSLCPADSSEAPAAAAAASVSMQQNFTIEWESLPDTWEALFGEHLSINPSEHSFVMSTLPDMTPGSKATMLEYMFEQFEVPCLRAESPAVLALHASGLCDGLVIDVGNRLSITPIVQGYVLVRRLRCTSDFDGRRLKKTSVRRSKRRTVRSAGAWR
eukprot:COSAG04_NODE_3705_length_2594_cov_1.636874_2_plen_545_part_00